MLSKKSKISFSILSCTVGLHSALAASPIIDQSTVNQAQEMSSAVINTAELSREEVTQMVSDYSIVLNQLNTMIENAEAENSQSGSKIFTLRNVGQTTGAIVALSGTFSSMYFAYNLHQINKEVRLTEDVGAALSGGAKALFGKLSNGITNITNGHEGVKSILSSTSNAASNAKAQISGEFKSEVNAIRNPIVKNAKISAAVALSGIALFLTARYMLESDSVQVSAEEINGLKNISEVLANKIATLELATK